MKGVFSVVMDDVTLAGATTMVFINPGAAISFEVVRAWAGQKGTATQQLIRIQFVTQVTAFPTLTSATPKSTGRFGDTSDITGATNGAAGTAGTNASNEGAGAKTLLLPDVMNNQIGWVWVPTLEERIIMPAGSTSGLGLYLPVAPTSLINWTAGITFRQLS